MSYLKTDKVYIERLDETIELVELCALGQRELMQAAKADDMFLASAIAVKYGTKKWRDAAPEDIMEQLPFEAIEEIALKVAELSDVGASEDDIAKNLESIPSVSSFSS